MAIIGTAGHIDHGKSALIRALTSIDPDRLPEEKRREMTIDLGFAWLRASSGEAVGIVDVPGHEDFIKNMIAGAGGIDAALLVIAADEGWMPQTEEHLQILDLLHIKHGIVALNKIDLINDPEWLDLIEEDVRERLKGTVLSEALVVRVSATKETNIGELRQRLEELVLKVSKRDVGKPRLPIDRIFSMKGSGVVVTGTLIDGALTRGDRVYIFPKNLRPYIRTIESYKEKKERAEIGTRVAVNLVGLEKEDLSRGDIIFGEEGQVKASKFIDASIKLVPQLAKPIKSNTEFKIYSGTREILGKITLLAGEVLKSGESAFAQIQFNEEVATRLGDYFIIRRPSPAETIGGGIVLDPLAHKHRFKDRDKVSLFLQRRIGLEINELILSELDKNKYLSEKELLVASHYSQQEAMDCVVSLRGEGKLIMAGSCVVDLTYWQKQMEQVLGLLAEKHSLHPLEKGFPQVELQSRLKLPKELFDHLIASLIGLGKIVREQSIIALSTHRLLLSPEQEMLVSQILKVFQRSEANPPTKKELIAQMPNSEGIIRYMCQQNMLVELPEGVLFERKRYEHIKSEIISFLKSNGSISFQQARTLLGFSRKYMLPLFNKLDEEGITQRRGDTRVLRANL